MEKNKLENFIKNVIDNLPSDWLKLTTHRLDIYEENLAKTQFLEGFEKLYKEGNSSSSALSELPTAYDYIRLGHPLSSVLEWAIAKMQGLSAENVICFSSRTAPLLAVLRKNLLQGTMTQILFTENLPEYFDFEALHQIYGYQFELKKVSKAEEAIKFDGSTVFLSQQDDFSYVQLNKNIDFYINIHAPLGSVIMVNGEKKESYISEIQHVRRRETIAMTPADSLSALKQLSGTSSLEKQTSDAERNKNIVRDLIQKITGSDSKVLVASSGLSIQYAIMMGLIDAAQKEHAGKNIRFIVPPNCYGGTNDQARRVAACIDNVEVVDLPVDRESNMVQSIDRILEEISNEDAVPYIIAEIPTNPRVEVPDLQQLKSVLEKKRKTAKGESAIEPVFILDQTFCPNVHFLGKGETLSSIRAISYASGSKFPSGGLCTAGYCIGNAHTDRLMEKVQKHLTLCDNEATDLQMEILAKQLPTMNQRIKNAYKNTREFVNFIHDVLPEAKINFVSEELAKQGFTPSVFSLDLPTKGNTEEEREAYKRAMNLKLINLMITEIPQESKFCVSYGQLKGCYWTIPATSTQGTTKEGDKDYIVRVSVSPNIDLELHKKVFSQFAQSL